MKTRYTNIFKSILVLCSVAFLFVSLNAAPVKRVVLEQHTGAWCGWCVDGTYYGDLLKEKYPETFIVVKNHNGDQMTLDLEKEIAGTFGLGGYPNGMVDRRIYGGKVMIDRGAWTPATEAALLLPPEVDVKATVDISGTTMTVNVEAEALVDMTRQLAFNVYICEDSVTGTGTGYDQANYLSGRAGYETNPYYTKPNPIVGYYHMAVARALLGGSLGSTTQFTSTTITKGQKFNQTFTYQIKTGQNPKKLYAVALVQEFEVSGTSLQKFSILNAVEVGRNVAKSVAVKATVASPYSTATPNANKTIDVLIKNDNPKSYDVTFEIDNSLSSIPDGWTVKLATASENLGAKGQFTLGLVVKPTATQAGFAKIAVTATPKTTDPDEAGKATTLVVSVLSDNTKHVIFEGLSAGSKDFANVMMANTTKGPLTVVLPFDENALKAYPPTMFDMVAFQVDYFNVPLFTNNVAICETARTYVTTMVNAGKKVFITAEGLGAQLGSANDAPTAQSFVNSLGIAKNGNLTLSVSVNSSGQITGYVQKKLAGEKGELSEGMMLTVNKEATGDATKRSIALDNIKTIGNSRIIFNHVNDAGGLVHGNSISNIIGDSRLVYLGFTFESLDANLKNQAANNIIAFLWGEATSVGPKATLSTNKIEFKDVKLGENDTKEVIITNDGDKDLFIYSVSLDNDMKEVFEIVSGGDFATVKANETQAIVIKFTPKAENTKYTAQIVVNTNIAGSTNYTIDLNGASAVGGSVEDGIAGNTGVFTMFAGPNPFATVSSLNYNLAGDVSKNVEITLIDISGKTISTLLNSNVAPGAGSLELNSSNLSNGTYILRAKVGTFTTQLPVVINK